MPGGSTSRIEEEESDPSGSRGEVSGSSAATDAFVSLLPGGWRAPRHAAAFSQASGSPAQAVRSKAKPWPSPAREDSPRMSGRLAGGLLRRPSTKPLFRSGLDSPELPEARAAQISPPRPRGRQLLPPGLLLDGAWTSAAATWTPGAAPTAAAPSKNARQAELGPGDEVGAGPRDSRPAVPAAWLSASSQVSAEGARSSSSCSKPSPSASPAGPAPAVGTPGWCVLGAGGNGGTNALSPTSAGPASRAKATLFVPAPGVAKAPRGSCSAPTLGAVPPESPREAAPVPSDRAGIDLPSQGKAEAAGAGAGASPGTPKSLGHAKFTGFRSASAPPLPEDAKSSGPAVTLPFSESSFSASPSSTSSSSLSGRPKGSRDALPSPPSPSGFALLGLASEGVGREACGAPPLPAQLLPSTSAPLPAPPALPLSSGGPGPPPEPAAQPLSARSPRPRCVFWGAGLKFRACLRGFSPPSAARGAGASPSSSEGPGAVEASRCPSLGSSACNDTIRRLSLKGGKGRERRRAF